MMRPSDEMKFIKDVWFKTQCKQCGKNNDLHFLACLTSRTCYFKNILKLKVVFCIGLCLGTLSDVSFSRFSSFCFD